MSFDVAQKPLRCLWMLAASVSAVGIGLAVELTQIHVRVHANPATRSFCTLSEHVSCDKTAQSAYAVLMGVPTSVWGLLAYSVILVLCILGWRLRRVFVIVPFVALSLVCALTAVSLAVVSLLLRNLCILCLATWVVDFTLLFLAVRMLRGVGVARATADVRELWKLHRAWLLAAVAVGLGLIPGTRLVTPNAWGRAAATTTRLTERARTGADAHLEQGVDAAGHPYMGAPNPKLTIVEYADYQCPHCATAHEEMRDLLAKNPRDIRIVHHQFPLDNQCNSLVQRPFHPHACQYARMAACASLMGKFWRANDYLFEHGREAEPITVESLAQNVGLDQQQLQVCLDTAGAEAVKADVEEGLGLKVQGTPTFVVDGKVYPGRIPDDVLSAFQK
jgi:protein-disulfide isomerase/uncharacterized membrane protein